MKLKKRFVITIAGTAGSSKSTLSQELERLLRDHTKDKQTQKRNA